MPINNFNFFNICTNWIVELIPCLDDESWIWKWRTEWREQCVYVAIQFFTFCDRSTADIKKCARYLRTFFALFDLSFLLVHGRSQQREDDSRLRVDADGRYNHFPTTFHYMGAWKRIKFVQAKLGPFLRFNRMKIRKLYNFIKYFQGFEIFPKIHSPYKIWIFKFTTMGVPNFKLRAYYWYFNLIGVIHIPESIMGSEFSPFLTWSDSPVSDDSSTFKSLLWITTPSAGNRSPYLTCRQSQGAKFRRCT